MQLVGGRAHEAERYTPQLVAAILRGVRRQLVRDGVVEENSVSGAPVVCEDNFQDAELKPNTLVTHRNSHM